MARGLPAAMTVGATYFRPPSLAECCTSEKGTKLRNKLLDVTGSNKLLIFIFLFEDTRVGH